MKAKESSLDLIMHVAYFIKKLINLWKIDIEIHSPMGHKNEKNERHVNSPKYSSPMSLTPLYLTNSFLPQTKIYDTQNIQKELIYFLFLWYANTLSYLPTPPLGQDMTQGQLLSGVLTSLNSEFSFS